ncbi:CofD-related protein of GAK system [Aliiruegeria haliotis]|uniref:CofD-related protein of GAK system n=1 Tax=Aliiruegeria haliotis TaxID=1280846 RepID=A0A2T0RZE1_9RHOB|nr:GAK system CofD-like protein [Aliiruegeria haliotis]PRY26551.1 CofD-related protein of GAK system [Aliiruegeria haliotis]
MVATSITRSAEIPDRLRIERCRSLPNLGPRLLFFSGGSALNGISRALKSYTFNSAHLITPFDSGGSSQVLRQAFDMPAVGDLRSRLMALADETTLGQPDIYRLFHHRLPADVPPAELAEEFASLLQGAHPYIRAIAQPMRGLILSNLRAFARNKPGDFDLAHASIGNLIIAGGYMLNDHALEPVLFLMSKMVEVRGTVRAVVDANLHVGADLSDGRRVIGQRQLTGKEEPPIDSPIARLFLSDGTRELPPGDVRLPKRNRKLIEQADLICYPPGSLYTSVIANLLPAGAGNAVALREVPKVYVPSLGHDPECPGMRLTDQVDALLSALRRDAGNDCPAERLITMVLTDAAALDAGAAVEIAERHGVPCIPVDLCAPDAADVYDPERLCDALVSLS